MRICCILLTALALAACAETDPYKRLDPASTGELFASDALNGFDFRWPRNFKCVQTVTLDFGIQTRTLVGYLVVGEPYQYRLTGMSEQGLKLFDIVSVWGKLKVVFAAEEFGSKVLSNIARDIDRVFLADGQKYFPDYWTGLSRFGDLLVDHRLQTGESGAALTLFGRHGDLRIQFVGKPPRVDWYEYRRDNRYLYRVDQYEWQSFGDLFLPSTIVLREPGIQSDGPAYKLTIKITELTVRDKPWPEKMFNPEKDD
jgi:hypothetical protein